MSRFLDARQQYSIPPFEINCISFSSWIFIQFVERICSNINSGTSLNYFRKIFRNEHSYLFLLQIRVLCKKSCLILDWVGSSFQILQRKTISEKVLSSSVNREASPENLYDSLLDVSVRSYRQLRINRYFRLKRRKKRKKKEKKSLRFKYYFVLYNLW